MVAIEIKEWAGHTAHVDGGDGIRNQPGNEHISTNVYGISILRNIRNVGLSGTFWKCC